MEKEDLSNFGLVSNPSKSVLNSDHQSTERASFRFHEIQVKELDEVIEKQAVLDESNLLMPKEQRKEMEALTKASNSESHMNCGADKTKLDYTGTDHLQDIHNMEEPSFIPKCDVKIVYSKDFDEQNEVLTTSLKEDPCIGDVGDQNEDQSKTSEKDVELVNISPVNQCVLSRELDLKDGTKCHSGVDMSKDNLEISANQIYSNIKSIHKTGEVQLEITTHDTEDCYNISSNEHSLSNEKFQQHLISSSAMKPDLLVDKQISEHSNEDCSETMEVSGCVVKATEGENHYGKAPLLKKECQEVQGGNVAVMQSITAYRDVKTADWSCDSESDSHSPSVISTSSSSSSSEDSSDDESSSSTSSPERNKCAAKQSYATCNAHLEEQKKRLEEENKKRKEHR
ncbi:suppressor protein SRP40-like [Limulus polyphemus]|uniref:Suppressor protein SRP40-like n=1 Tax=Limulus polyphemus TaxID=6850 RepID=A0ABM1S196_LIMPO|nr:suppressor protein SRP40-like [Limulus polyphemus]